jgi:hypothetical protein
VAQGGEGGCGSGHETLERWWWGDVNPLICSDSVEMPRETSALLLQPHGGEQTNTARFFNRFRCSDFNY